MKGYDLHYCEAGYPWRDRVIIPIYDPETGYLQAFQGRLILHGEPRYRTEGPRPIYIPTPEFVKETLVIVEGPFDLYSVQRAGYGAIALLGISCSHWQRESLCRFVASKEWLREVLIWLDNDRPEAVLAAIDLRILLSPFRRVRIIDEGNSTKRDPGEMSRDEVKGTIDRSV